MRARTYRRCAVKRLECQCLPRNPLKKHTGVYRSPPPPPPPPPPPAPVQVAPVITKSIEVPFEHFFNSCIPCFLQFEQQIRFLFDSPFINNPNYWSTICFLYGQAKTALEFCADEKKLMESIDEIKIEDENPIENESSANEPADYELVTIS